MINGNKDTCDAIVIDLELGSDASDDDAYIAIWRIKIRKGAAVSNSRKMLFRVECFILFKYVTSDASGDLIHRAGHLIYHFQFDGFFFYPWPGKKALQICDEYRPCLPGANFS